MWHCGFICSIHFPCCSFLLQWSCDCNKHLLPLLLALDYNNCTATRYCVLCIDNDNKTTSVETSCINSLQICQHQPSPASTASSCIVFYIFDSDIHGYSKFWEKLSASNTMKVPANVSFVYSMSKLKNCTGCWMHDASVISRWIDDDTDWSNDHNFSNYIVQILILVHRRTISCRCKTMQCIEQQHCYCPCEV